MIEDLTDILPKGLGIYKLPGIFGDNFINIIISYTSDACMHDSICPL